MSDAFLPGNGFDTYETQDKVLVSMDGTVDCGVVVRILQQQGFAVQTFTAENAVTPAELLRLLCQFEEINIAQSVAVGDGANDLPMLNLAGLGIAFHAKPKVKATARQSISTIGLDGILYFLGLKDSRIEQ